MCVSLWLAIFFDLFLLHPFKLKDTVVGTRGALLLLLLNIKFATKEEEVVPVVPHAELIAAATTATEQTNRADDKSFLHFRS